MDNKLRVGGNVRKWRNLKGMKQKELANALHLSEAAMSNIENNITDVTLGQLEAISRALEIGLEQLFTDPQDSFGPPKENGKTGRGFSSVEDSELIYAVIRSLEMKDQQLQAILQNLLHTMTTLAGTGNPAGRKSG